MRADIQESIAPGRSRSSAGDGSDLALCVFARVDVLTDPSLALEAWRELEAIAPISPFQTSGFLLPWIGTEGRAAGIVPFLVLAYDRHGRVLALLPLGVRRSPFMRVAGFLGGKQCNYNMGLFRPGPVWRPTDIVALFRAAAAASPLRVDMFALLDQPHQWQAIPNPLALWPGQPSPSFSHRAVLPADPDAFFDARHSNHARKLLRTKRNRLDAVGAVSHRVARSAHEIDEILSTHLAQKASKLAAAGVRASLDSPARRAFLQQASQPSPEGAAALELHALHCGERIVATFGGLAHAGHFSGMLISHDAELAYARNSPGDLLLASVIRMKCLEGFGSFDLGVGEARYKETYCPVPDPLFDSFFPLTPVGRLCLVGESLRLRVKRAVKRSVWAWPAVQRLRRLRARIANAIPRR